jgi:hypothetical protein
MAITDRPSSPPRFLLQEKSEILCHFLVDGRLSVV